MTTITWFALWVMQGTVLVLAVAAVLRLLPRVSASVREVAWWSALAGVLVMPWLPAWSVVVEALPALPDPVLMAAPTLADVPDGSGGDPWTLLAAAWVIWVALSATRLVYGVRTLACWRVRCVPLSRRRQRELPAWSRLRTAGRRAHVMVSADVATPCVLGLWQPIIALPSSALMLEASALDAIVVHEYAHVQRRDDFAQLLQHVIRAVCGLHPAVWWLDRQLSLEREAACDDWAVAFASARTYYAACLITLSERGQSEISALAPGVRGTQSQLGRRVARLLDPQQPRDLRLPWGRRTGVIATTYVLAATVAGVEPAVRSGESLPTLPPHVTRTWPVPRVPIAGPVHTPAAAPRADGRPGQRHVAPPSRDIESGGYAEPAPVSMRVGVGVGATAREEDVVNQPQAAALPGVRAMPMTTLAPAITSTGAQTYTTADTADAESAAPWHALADAGRTVGRGAAMAGDGLARGGVVTAGFFTRAGKRIGGAF